MVPPLPPKQRSSHLLPADQKLTRRGRGGSLAVVTAGVIRAVVVCGGEASVRLLPSHCTDQGRVAVLLSIRYRVLAIPQWQLYVQPVSISDVTGKAS